MTNAAVTDSSLRMVLTIRPQSDMKPKHTAPSVDISAARQSKTSAQVRDRKSSKPDTVSLERSTAPASKPTQTSGVPQRKASLSHYQEQLMHLERLNKKRLQT